MIEKWNILLIVEGFEAPETVKVRANSITSAITTAERSWRYWNGFPMRRSDGSYFNKPNASRIEFGGIAGIGG